MKNETTQINATSNKKPKVKVAKKAVETLMPEGLEPQVHVRTVPTNGYKICNGTSFEPYVAKPWGR